MIKLKLTKDKFIAVISVLDAIIDRLNKQIPSMKQDMAYARIKADVYVLQDLSRKMRSKLVMIEDRSGSHPMTYSVTEPQACCIMQYYTPNTKQPYSMAIMQEISDPIYQKLLC